MLELPNACDSVDRELLWAILYKKGLPEKMIKRIRMGRENIKLRPKAKGNLGKKQINSKGVFHGSPLGALLFIIYFDHMLEMHAGEQKAWKNQEIQEILAKNQEQEENGRCANTGTT